ncbi:MAG: hypothetical protein M0C28_40340 [Candidatus Moduliflexus flocculans]|nr:hypothetical protein [Candidatus Moduliflexus flocculans]
MVEGERQTVCGRPPAAPSTRRRADGSYMSRITRDVPNPGAMDPGCEPRREGASRKSPAHLGSSNMSREGARRCGDRRRAIPMAACAALALAAAAPACKTAPPADVPGRVHPSTAWRSTRPRSSALYRSARASASIDLAAFQTTLRSPAVGGPARLVGGRPRGGFLACGQFALLRLRRLRRAHLGGGAETYVLSDHLQRRASRPTSTTSCSIQKSGSWLGLVRAWGEGSACSGGLHNQRMDGDNFLYSRDLTPVDLLELAQGVELGLNAHEDLEAASDSCFAAANYVYNLIQDREDLVSVRLYDEPAVDEKGKTDALRHQSCFNRIFNDYLSRGKTALTPKEVDELAARFRDECLPAKWIRAS